MAKGPPPVLPETQTQARVRYFKVQCLVCLAVTECFSIWSSSTYSPGSGTVTGLSGNGRQLSASVSKFFPASFVVNGIVISAGDQGPVLE